MASQFSSPLPFGEEFGGENPLRNALGGRLNESPIAAVENLIGLLERVDQMLEGAGRPPQARSSRSGQLPPVLRQELRPLLRGGQAGAGFAPEPPGPARLGYGGVSRRVGTWELAGNLLGHHNGNNLIGQSNPGVATSRGWNPNAVLVSGDEQSGTGIVGRAFTGGDLDPAYLAGLSGNDAYLNREGNGFTGVPNGAANSNGNAPAGHVGATHRENDTGFNVPGNDAASGGGSGANTVSGVQQSIHSNNGNALNNELGQNNFGTFADNTVPNGILNLNQSGISQVSHMSQTQLAMLHLWGLQMSSQGHQDGGILLNVLQNPSQFTTAEVQVAQQLANEDQQKYGGITGKSLDQGFFGVYQSLTGQNISSKFANAPMHYANGPVNISNRVNGNNGLSDFENTVLVMWGHTPLFGNGINGSLESDVLSSKSNVFSQAGADTQGVQALADADLATSGQITGQSLNAGFDDVLNKLYNGGPDVTAQQVVNQTIQHGPSTVGLSGVHLSPRVASLSNRLGTGQLNNLALGVTGGSGQISNLNSFLNEYKPMLSQALAHSGQSPHFFDGISASDLPPGHPTSGNIANCPFLNGSLGAGGGSF
jgi:hypothetical protein